MLTIEHLALSYLLPTGKELPALQDFNLTIKQGQMLGLVGESGCGKTTLCHVLTKSLPYHGSITFESTELKALTDTKAYYAQVQYIFQDPKSTVPPHMNLEHWALAPLKNLKGMSQRQAQSLIQRLMTEVGLDPELLARKPSEVSLGQLQRLSLIKSLALEPKLLLCDEITSALDPKSTQLCLELLTDYVRRTKLSVLFITHDLSTALTWCPHVAVMFKGQILEQGPAYELKHPYLQSLKHAAQVLAGLQAPAPPVNGAPTVTCPMKQERLCPWLMRCSKVQDQCLTQKPKLRPLSPEHQICCHVA